MAIPTVINTIMFQPFKGKISYSFVELKELQHIEVIKDFMLEKTNILLNEMAFGRESSTLYQMELMENLMFYLLIMYENRLNDKSYSEDAYRNTYCIKCILKSLFCRGISAKLINQILSLYFENSSDSSNGIGYMIIEDTFKIK